MEKRIRKINNQSLGANLQIFLILGFFQNYGIIFLRETLRKRFTALEEGNHDVSSGRGHDPIFSMDVTPSIETEWESLGLI
jgi:hypothetical protein